VDTATEEIIRFEESHQGSPFTSDVPRDGRVARGRRTQRAVAEALIALLKEGEPDPTAKAVAAKAGVSLRLVFHHFGDMDDLYRCAAGMQLQERLPQLPNLEGLSLHDRIRQLVDHRASLYEHCGLVHAAFVRRGATSPEVRDIMTESDDLLRANLDSTFAPELDQHDERTRLEILAALDTATSWESWERLRTTIGLPDSGARRVMAMTVTALCVLAPRPAPLPS